MPCGSFRAEKGKKGSEGQHAQRPPQRTAKKSQNGAGQESAPGARRAAREAHPERLRAVVRCGKATRGAAICRTAASDRRWHGRVARVNPVSPVERCGGSVWGTPAVVRPERRCVLRSQTRRATECTSALRARAAGRQTNDRLTDRSATGEVPWARPTSADAGAVQRCSASRCRACLLYTSPSPRDRQKSRMPSSA